MVMEGGFVSYDPSCLGLCILRDDRVKLSVELSARTMNFLWEEEPYTIPYPCWD